MNIGDVITTGEQVAALPVGSVLYGGITPSQSTCDVYVRWPHGWCTDGIDGFRTWLSEVEVLDPPLTVLALPDQTPRPERVVKAEALREAAAHIKNLYGTPLPPAIVHGILHGLAAYAEAREA